MDINQGINYMFSRDGQQFGPVEGTQLVQMAQAGQVLVGDYIWSEGYADWVPAGYFNQLAPLFGLSSRAPPTGPQQPATASGPVVETAVDTSGALQVKRTGVSGPGIRKANIQTSAPHAQGYDSSSSGKPGASFGIVVFSFLLWVLGTFSMVGLTLFSTIVIAGPDQDPEDITFGAQVLIDKPYISVAVWSLYLIGMILSAVVTLRYVYRAWTYIQDLPSVTTTPGRAVGFLFIPFFNVVWLFFTYYKWARDYNMRCDLSDPISSKRANEGLFLAHCILTILALGMLTYLPVMYQMCRAINKLALSPELEIDPNAGYSL